MKISHGTRFKKTSAHNGYGYATEGMLNSLQRLGYHVEQNDASADVEIWFDQPHYWKFSDGPYTDGKRGIGLGLAICKAIVEAHGGTIRAQANVPNGARLVFTLPLETKPEAKPGNNDDLLIGG